MKIEIHDQLPGDIAKRMERDLADYEHAHGIHINYMPLSFILYNEHNEAIGVLNAYTAFAEIYIDDIWVDSRYRRQGCGRRLIAALEAHFSGKGFNNINLCTSAFQAPAFYEKCGFELEFIRKNNQNKKLDKYFFVKFLKVEK